MAWVEFYIITLCPHIFSEQETSCDPNLEALPAHSCIIFYKKTMFTIFKSHGLKSGTWADVQIVDSSVIPWHAEGDKFKISNPCLNSSAWSQREFYIFFSRNKVRFMVLRFYHVSKSLENIKNPGKIKYFINMLFSKHLLNCMPH